MERAFLKIWAKQAAVWMELSVMTPASVLVKSMALPIAVNMEFFGSGVYYFILNFRWRWIKPSLFLLQFGLYSVNVHPRSSHYPNSNKSIHRMHLMFWVSHRYAIDLSYCIFTSSTSMIAYLPMAHYIILLFSFFDKLSLISLLSARVPYAFSDIN